MNNLEEECTISVTTYKENETEVLNFLNTNRPQPRSRCYLNWRYLGEQVEKPALIFWLVDGCGNKVGMSSLIFRSYLANGEKVIFGISGDTFIKKEFRGIGIGKKLFNFIREYMKKEEHRLILALANEAGTNAMRASGWKVIDEFVTYVFVLDISEKIFNYIHNEFISMVMSRMVTFLIGLRLKTGGIRDIQFKTVTAFTDALECFFKERDGSNLITRYRNNSTFRWRYLDHPEKKYTIYQAMLEKEIIGVLVFTIANGHIAIEDFIVKQMKYIKIIMLNFIRTIKKRRNRLKTIRFGINGRHPYSASLRKNGFFRRQPSGALVVCLPDDAMMAESHGCLFTYGDKDI